MNISSTWTLVLMRSVSLMKKLTFNAMSRYQIKIDAVSGFLMYCIAPIGAMGFGRKSCCYRIATKWRCSQKRYAWALDLLYHWVFRNQPPQFFCNRTILAYKILKTAPISKMSRTTLKLRLRVFGIEHYPMIFNVLGLPCYYVFWNRRPKIS